MESVKGTVLLCVGQYDSLYAPHLTDFSRGLAK